ncbi:MAG: hypothetical protein ABIP39_03825 [Polyangiaceae bacterium]
MIGPISLKGTVSGGAFVPKVALINIASVGSSDVFITITDGEASCDKPYIPAEGERNVEVRLAWKPGSYDIAAKKLGIKFGVLRRERRSRARPPREPSRSFRRPLPMDRSDASA